MEIKSIRDLEKKYELELGNVLGKIKKAKAGLVLLQFPDGLKPYATAVVDFLKKETNAEFLIWFGSCYGACDIPVLGKKLEKEIDLIIQFGHNGFLPGY